MLNGNWVDFIIILSLVFFAHEALRVGFWVILADFASFFGSLLISLRIYPLASALLRSNFSFTGNMSNAIGFLLSAIVAEGLLGIVFGYLISLLPRRLRESRVDKILALIPVAGEGIILISFILTLIISLPVAPLLKKSISDSRIGAYLLSQTSGVEKKMSDIFGKAVEDSLTHLIVEPDSKESVPLQIEVGDLVVDSEGERAMLALVNKERSDRGLGILVWSDNLCNVARTHATDMWKRKYFSHYSPEGEDVGDRLGNVGIIYLIAGENLALAPTLTLAHSGLMNSEGHKANILEQKFNKIGIGVVDNGIYGKMFVQVFTE